MAAIENDNGSVFEGAAQIARDARGVEHLEIARHKAALPQHPRIGELRDPQNPGRRRARVLEPVDHRIGLLRARRPTGAAGFRASLEPMRASDETEIDQRSVRMIARARVGPGLLLDTRAGGVDVQPDARACCEIECGDRNRSTEARGDARSSQ